MGLLKRFTKSETGQRVLGALITAYIRFVRLTSTWGVEGTEDRNRCWEDGRPFLIALWHNRIGMMPYAYPEKFHELFLLASAHSDGRLVPSVLCKFGMTSILVDSKEPAKATRAVVKKLREGERVGICPDGPRGPRLEVKEGTIVIAAMTGAAIIPVTYSMRRRLVLGSWDRFIVPLPFNRGVCRWGRVIEVPRGADAETRAVLRRELEDAMNALTDGLDRDMGHAPIPRADNSANKSAGDDP
jgi:lysophospholipid acyltransferase (LPLAT)-like uncharacterized protein